MGAQRSRAKTKGAMIRESVQKREHRFPRHIAHSDIATMPRYRFVDGMESGIFISREHDESRFFSQGLCFHDADMDDLVWDEVSWDEAFYCMKGQLVVLVEDVEGNTAEFIVDEGDHIWLPAGYKYILRASGVDSINFWTMAPVLHSGWRNTGDPAGPAYSDMLVSTGQPPKKSPRKRKQ